MVSSSLARQHDSSATRQPFPMDGVQSRVRWDHKKVRALRSHLKLTQQEMAHHLGTRQQTISDWETGAYQPRGTSSTLLNVIAERVDFVYQTGPTTPPGQDGP